MNFKYTQNFYSKIKPSPDGREYPFLNLTAKQDKFKIDWNDSRRLLQKIRND